MTERELSSDEIVLMFRIDAIGSTIHSLICEMEEGSQNESGPAVNTLWFEMARTSLKLGLMQLAHSLAKPINS